ncbi:MAG TPA: ABC transporter permease [Trueperaceae bacterium]|nr:ABC transporter permease [Trueperaceae bacterium]
MAPNVSTEQAAAGVMRGRSWHPAIAGVIKVLPIFLILAGILVWIAFLNPRFLEPAQFLNFIRRSAPLMILAGGQLFVIVVGGFDLSQGSLVTLTVLLGALLASGDPSTTWWVILLLYGIALAVGVFNGAVTSYLRVPSFITTLGMLLTLKGAALLATGGAPRGALPTNFRAFGRAYIEGVPLLGRVPWAVIVLLVIGGVLIFLFHYTQFGKQALAVGDNQHAARLSGVNVGLVRIAAFVVSALSAVTAGIMLGGFSGVSLNVGDGLELESISAVVLGGAALLGGRGNMLAALAGALTLQALFTLLNFLGLPSPIRVAVQGVIIIGAVGFASWRAARGGQETEA